MNILNKLFPKKKSPENIEAHKVVEKKTQEAHDVLNEIQGKMLQVATDIESERKRTNKEMSRKVKEIRDVAERIAIVTRSVS